MAKPTSPMETAERFLVPRRQDATGDGLRELLARVPDGAPLPGDELPSDLANPEGSR